MAIIVEEIQEISAGIAKGIDPSAMNLILENLQRFQYQYPIKSTVREIACNGVDSAADKNSAKDILLNGAPVSKYYEDLEGELYRDSKFKPEYYNPKWLSPDNNVYITYVEGNGVEKDMITFEDFGTGLGRGRLEGFFGLGYSTKRLSKQPLGKFGIGAKSPLSVGVEFYTVESRYNGELYRFNVYSNTVQSIIPRFNMSTGKENGHVIFDAQNPDPTKRRIVYFEETDELNGVAVTIAAKKNHKHQYIEAVRTQLLYFKNIVFRIVAHGRPEDVSYQAPILYEDEDIILSDNSIWDRPHLLLNRVNYGYINWEELELENKQGNIGIKVDPALVDINPSRESVIWSEKTKEVILNQYKKVVGIATNLVTKELTEPDFVKWMRICYQTSNGRRATGGSVVSKLANIVDMTQIRPKFPLDDRISWRQSSMLDGFNLRYYHNGYNTRVIRENLKEDLGALGHLPIVLIDANTAFRRDKFILARMYRDGFIGISKQEEEEPAEDEKATAQAVLDLSITPEEKKAILRKKERAAIIAQWLEKSTEVVKYSSIVVPEDFTCKEDTDDDEETEEDEEVAAIEQISHEERRKQEGKTVVHYVAPDYTAKAGNSPYFCWNKDEVRISSLNGWNTKDDKTGQLYRDTYYGNDADSEKIHFAAFLCSKAPGDSLNYLNLRIRPDVRLIKVAQTNTRLYRDFKHINRFFLNVKNNKISMANALIKWNTARLMLKGMQPLNFLFNFSSFDAEKAADYAEVCEYIKQNYSEVNGNHNDFGVTKAAHDGLLSHLEKVQSFQEYVVSGAEPEQISDMAKALFGNPKLTDGVAVDMEIFSKYKELAEYAIAVGPLLNTITMLTGLFGGERYTPTTGRTPETICGEVEQAIKEYLAYKGVV